MVSSSGWIILKKVQSPNDGIPIPDMFPVAYIHAGDKAEAKEILLSISSQYGDWDDDELTDWLDDMDSDITESLRFMDREFDLNENNEINEKEIDILKTDNKCPSCGHEW